MQPQMKLKALNEQLSSCKEMMFDKKIFTLLLKSFVDSKTFISITKIFENHLLILVPLTQIFLITKPSSDVRISGRTRILNIVFVLFSLKGGDDELGHINVPEYDE